jgi:hypothetical protein
MAGNEQSPYAGGEHLHGGDRLVRALGILQAEQVFGTQEGRDAFLQDLDSDRMIHLLEWANGVVRGAPPLRPGLADPSQGSVVVNFATERPTIVCVPPLPEDRPELFGGLLEATKAAPTQEDQGLLLGLGINLVHLRDGSGRMARMADSLLTRGYDGSPEDKLYYMALLENTEGRLLLDPQPRPLLNNQYAGHVGGQLWHDAGFYGAPPEQVAAPDITFVINEHSLHDAKMLATLLCHEESFAPANMLAIIKETGRRVADYLRRHPDEEKLVLDGTALIDSINPSEAEAVRRAHTTIKHGFIDAVTRCLRDGEQDIFGPPDTLRRRYAPVDRPLLVPPAIADGPHTHPPDQLPRRRPGAGLSADPMLEALRRVTETMQKNTETPSE